MSSGARILMFAGTLGLVPGAACAAEWSVAPAFFLNADHQTNRTLSRGVPDSQSLGASLDVSLKRRTQSGELEFAPHYFARRISPKVEADVDDLNLPVRLNLGFERSSLSFGAQYADESTLTTELETTGVIYPDASRLLRAADAGWRFAHANARELNVSASYSDVRYTGGYDQNYSDYDYGALSVAETLTLSPRLALTFAGFGSHLHSEQRGSDNREAGISVGFDYSWSEATQMSATFGMSRRDFDGEHTQGGTGSFNLSHRGETREWRLALDQGLEPYSNGVLAERTTGQFSMIQHFDPRLLAQMRVGLSRNEDVVVPTGVDARTYRYADVELRWLAKETWSVSAICGYADSQLPYAPEREEGWTVALRTGWSPSRHVLGH